MPPIATSFKSHYYDDGAYDEAEHEENTDGRTVQDGAAVEAQLTATMHQHLTSFRETFNALETSTVTSRQATANLSDLRTLCQKTSALIGNFGAIQVTSRTYRNFAETRRMWRKFAQLDVQVERCAELIREDQAVLNEKGNDDNKDKGLPRNILLVAYYLSELSKFERETMALIGADPVTTNISAPSRMNSPHPPPSQSQPQPQSQASPSSQAATMAAQLRKYFRRLDELRASFEDYFWTLPRRMLDIAACSLQSDKEGTKKDNNRWLLVHIAKGVLKAGDAGLAKGRLKGAWETAVAAKFAASLGSAQAGNGVLDTLNGVGFWTTDLETVRDAIVPAFPLSWDVLDTFALLYHRCLHDILQHLGTRSRLTPGDILTLLSWLRGYYANMSAKFGLSEEILEPRMLRDREAVLTRTYLEQSREKLHSWTTNLLTSETKAFMGREQPPDLDAEDQYLTPAAVDLYQIVKQNIDTALMSKTPFLVSAVLDSAVASVRDFQRGLTRALQGECARFCDVTSAQKTKVAPYFEEYVMMLGNSGLCWVRFMDDLAAKLEGDFSPAASPDVARSLKGLRDSNEGFVQLAKDSVDVLVRVIMASVAPAYAQLFLSSNLGNGGVKDHADTDPMMESICTTFEDFLQDYNRHYNPFLMKRLAAQLLDAHILAYVEAMRAKGIRLPPTIGIDNRSEEGEGGQAGGILTRHTAFVAQYFVTAGWRDEKRTEKALEPLTRLATVLEAPPKLVFMEAATLFQICPDLNPSILVDELLAKRADLDRTSLKDLAESIQSKAHEQRAAAPDVTSVFSRLAKRSSNK